MSVLRTNGPLVSRVRKTMTGNNPKLDPVDVHTKFGLILSVSSDIERKPNSEVNQRL